MAAAEQVECIDDSQSVEDDDDWSEVCLSASFDDVHTGSNAATEDAQESNFESLFEEQVEPHRDLGPSISNVRIGLTTAADDEQKCTSKGKDKEKKAFQKPVQRMALNDHKAGMEGLDKEKINKIIFEASKGSKFYENERKKEKRVAERIKSLKDLQNSFNDLDFQNAKKEANKFAKEIENERDLGRIIVHIDMDAFYAAVETRDDPSLKDVPMAVGSNYMLSTSNYAARRYGVRAAMPGFIAKKLCPHLKMVPLNFTKYREVSNQVKSIIAEYDPNFSGIGLDEAYLDITDYVKTKYLFTGDSLIELQELQIANIVPEISLHRKYAEDTVQELRAKIFDKTKLTASAGIAPNLMLAKICSDMNKPNGQYYLPPQRDKVLEFIKELPIRKVSGIGRVSEQILNEFGIINCKDLYEKRALLYLLFSAISFQHFIRISCGISSTVLDNESDRKSMSSETTFGEVSDPNKIYKICQELCEGLANDLQKEGIAGRSVTVKFKMVNFEVKTRCKTVSEYLDSAEEIFKIARGIIVNQIKVLAPKKLKLRLLGVRVSEFGEKEKKQNKLDSFLVKGRSPFVSQTKGENISQMKNEERDIATSSAIPKPENFVTCPICQSEQPSNEINSHVDSCLNKQAIKEMLSENRKEVNTATNERPQLNKRKTRDGTKSNKPAKRKTLDSFWTKK